MTIISFGFLLAFQIFLAVIAKNYRHQKQTNSKSLGYSLYLNIISGSTFLFLLIYVSKKQDSYLLALVYVLALILTNLYFLRYFRLFKYFSSLLSLPYSKILKKIQPLTKVILLVASYIPNPINKKIFSDKADLIDFLSEQKKSDIDIPKNNIEIAVNGLKFGDLFVKDFYTPRKMVKFINVEQEISTVFLDDLYKSGFSRFPVYSDEKDNIVGTLYLKDLVEQKFSGKITKIMSTEVYEVSDSDKLDDTLKKYIKTRHHIFIVKNQFGEMIGVITLEDVLEQLIGVDIVDESDKHQNLRKIATKENN